MTDNRAERVRTRPSRIARRVVKRIRGGFDIQIRCRRSDVADGRWLYLARWDSTRGVSVVSGREPQGAPTKNVGAEGEIP